MCQQVLRTTESAAFDIQRRELRPGSRAEVNGQAARVVFFVGRVDRQTARENRQDSGGAPSTTTIVNELSFGALFNCAQMVVDAIEANDARATDFQ